MTTCAVEGTLQECVAEYAAVLDHFNQTALSEELPQLEDEDIFQQLPQTAPLLNKVLDREFENIANIAVFVLSQGPSQFSEKFVDSLVESQELGTELSKNKKKTIKTLSVLSVLSTVYNTSNDVSLKRHVINKILSVVAILGDYSLLKPFAAGITQLDDDSAESKEIINKTAALLKDSDPLETLRLHKLTMSTQQELDSYVVESLNTKSALDLTSVLELSISDNLKKYVEEYLYAPYASFTKLATPQGVDAAIVNEKKQFLSLLSLASDSPTLSFATLIKELSLEESNVELFLFNAIKAKIVEGKISQTEQLFHVYKVKLIVKKIDSQDWLRIKEVLQGYKKSLQQVRELIVNKK